MEKILKQVAMAALVLIATTLTASKAQAAFTYYKTSDANFTSYPYYRSVTGKVLAASRDQISMKLTSPLYGINGNVRIFLKIGDLSLLQRAIGRPLRFNEPINLGLMCNYGRDISLGYLAGGWLIIGNQCRFRHVGIEDVDPLAAIKEQIKPIFRDVLGREADNSSLDAFAKLVSTGSATISDVRVRIVAGNECRSAINTQYSNVLGRNATESEIVSNQNFLAYESGTLSMIKSRLMETDEYKSRFASSFYFDYSQLSGFYWW